MSVVSPIERPSVKGRVINNSDKEYKEMYRGEMITIPARGSLVMDFHEACDFRGQFVSPKDGVGQKPLTVERVSELDPEWRPAGYVSHIDGKVFPTKEALDAHMAERSQQFVAVKNAKLDEQVGSADVMLKIASALETLSARLEKLETKRGKKSDTIRNNGRGESVQSK